MCLLVFAFAFIYRRTHSASLLAWTEVQQLLDAVLRSSDERDELLQRLYHDNVVIMNLYSPNKHGRQQ